MIELTNVTRSYGNGLKVMAVNDLSMSVAAGERVAVMGPSGSGKIDASASDLRIGSANLWNREGGWQGYFATE